MSSSPHSWNHESNDFTNYYQSQSHSTRSSRLDSKSVISTVLFIAYLVHKLAHHYQLVNSSPAELLWYIGARIVPGVLLDYLDTQVDNESYDEKTTARKINQMQRIFDSNLPYGAIGWVSRLGKSAISTRKRLSSFHSLTSITSHNTRMDHRPAGLGNDDNSCYQNSILQGLASLDTLSPYLVEALEADTSRMPAAQVSDHDNTDGDYDVPSEPGKSEVLTMTTALQELMKKLRGEDNDIGRRLWTPLSLKNMDSYQQQDAQEYFSRLLDEVDKEIQKASSGTRGSSLPHFADSTPTLLELGSQASATLSKPASPLEGLLAQRVGCTACGLSEGLNMIPFNNLTLPLGRAWQYSVAQCLDEYTKIETIDSVECGKCTLLKLQSQLSTIVKRLNESNSDTKNDQILTTATARLSAVQVALDNDDFEEKTLKACGVSGQNKVKSTKTKQIVIARPPKSLVVHMQRSMFDEYFNPIKNTAVVRFPKQLDLAHWCLGSTNISMTSAERVETWQLDPKTSMIGGSTVVSGPIYELKAVVTHSGRHENGHYICYRRHPRLAPMAEVTADISDTGGTPEAQGLEMELEKQIQEQWWRLSDDDVAKVDETIVENQGGAFMLFYDCVEDAEELPCDEAVAPQCSIPVAERDANSILPEVPVNEKLSSTTSMDASLIDSDDEDTSKQTIEVEHKHTQPLIISSIQNHHRPIMSKSNKPNASNGIMV